MGYANRGDHQVCGSDHLAGKLQVVPNLGIMLSRSIIKRQRHKWRESLFHRGRAGRGKAMLSRSMQQFCSHN